MANEKNTRHGLDVKQPVAERIKQQPIEKPLTQVGMPHRIVTLLPSATEIVCALGLQDQLVGITHECNYPNSIVDRPIVTQSTIAKGLSSQDIDLKVRDHLSDNSALYSIDQALMSKLEPTVIVTQALCDVCAVAESEVKAVIENLNIKPRLLNLEPMSLNDVFDTILMVGKACGVSKRAEKLVQQGQQTIRDVEQRRANLPSKPKVAFLEWIDPPFNAGHWTPEIIELAGGIDCLGNKHQPSRTISYEEIQAAAPDVMVVALCGFDEQRAAMDMDILKSNLDWASLPCVKNDRVHVVDGNAYFSRSGPRLIDSLLIMEDILWR
ncbi:MAG: cobalamin-binding protein [Pseudomonadales bacterium]|nr:cobalamin-binding protein [Pseudomonadales bacterium]